MALQNEQDQLTAAWRALGAESGQGWRVIELVRKLNCTVHAGRRAPGNEESLLIGIEGSPVGRDVQLPRGRDSALPGPKPLMRLLGGHGSHSLAILVGNWGFLH